jgi:chromosome segregation ATPase
MPDDNNPLMQIKEVIDSNVRYATIDDLKRGGNRRFKVMKMGQFYSLVERAVNNVIRSESLTLAAEEKQRLIEESDLEFKRLLTERQGELQDIQNKEEELLQARREADHLAIEAQALRDRNRVIAEELRETELRDRAEIGELADAKQAIQDRNDLLAKEIDALQEQAREAVDFRTKQVDQSRALKMIETRLQATEQALEKEQLKSRTLTKAHEGTSQKLRRAVERVRFLEGEQTRLQRAFKKERGQTETLGRALTEAQARMAEERDLEADLKRVTRLAQMLRADRETLEKALTETREKALTGGRQADEERRKLETHLQEIRADATEARELLNAAKERARRDLLGIKATESQLVAELEAEQARRVTVEAELEAERAHLKEVLRGTEESSRQANAEAEGVRTKSETLETELEQSREAQSEAERRLEEALRELETRTSRVSGLEERHALDKTELEEALERLRERDEDASGAQTLLEETKTRLNEDLETERTRRAALETDIEAERALRSTLEADLETERTGQAEAMRRSEESSREALDLKEGKDQALVDAEKARATIAALGEDLERGRQALAETTGRLDDIKREADARAVRMRGLEERHDLDRTELEETLERLHEREEAIRSAEQRIEQTEAAARERSEEIDRLQREKERLDDLVHERGEVSKEMRRLQEKLSGREDDLRRARERFVVLEEKNRVLDERATNSRRSESEAVETAGRYRTRVETALHALEEREKLIATLKEHIGQLTSMRENHDREQTAVQAGLDRLGDELLAERASRETDREILQAEARRQESLLEEMGTLRCWLEKRLGDDGRALKAIRSGLGAVSPLADEIGAIKDMLSEGGGPGGQSERLMEHLEASISSGIERIEKELTERIESIKRQEAAENAARAIEAAEIDLDRLFIHDFDIETNLEAIGVRSANTGSIDGNLEKLRRLRGPGVPGDDSASEDS